MTLAKIKGILFTNASVWERKYNYQNTQGKVQSSAPFSTLFDCKCCEKKVRLRFCLRPKTEELLELLLFLLLFFRGC